METILESFQGYPLRKSDTNQLKHLVLKPTLICNFFCSFCQERRELHNKILKSKCKLLKLNDYKKILIDGHNLGFNAITLSGAEPTLYKYFNDLCEFIQTFEWSESYLMTNGSNLNSRNQHIINETFKYIEISFSDYSPQQFLKNRNIKNSNMFKTVYNNISRYNKIKKNFTINCIVLTRDRLLNLDKILTLSKILNFDDINLQLLEGNFNNYSERITIDDFNYFYKYIYPVVIKKFDNYKKYITDVLCIIDRELNNNMYRISENCGIPGNLIIVLPNGDIHPCNMIEYTHDFKCLSLFENSLQTVLSSIKYQQFAENKHEFCQKCPMLLH